MIVHGAPDHTAKPNLKVRNAVVETTAQMRLDIMEFGPQALGNGLALNCDTFSLAVRSSDVSETQEVKRLRPPLPQVPALGSGSRTKLDQTSFVRVQQNTEIIKTVPKGSQEAFRL